MPYKWGTTELPAIAPEAVEDPGRQYVRRMEDMIPGQDAGEVEAVLYRAVNPGRSDRLLIREEGRSILNALRTDGQNFEERTFTRLDDTEYTAVVMSVSEATAVMDDGNGNVLWEYEVTFIEVGTGGLS